MLSRFKRWFYGGPRDLGLSLRGRSGYQSPTVTAAAWLLALVLRHLTVAGRVVAGCCVLLLPYSLVTTAMPIYILAFAVAMLFVVDAGVNFWLRPRLAVERRRPVRVGAGAELSVVYRLRNLRSLPAWNLRVDSLPLPAAIRRVAPAVVVDHLGGGDERVLQARWVAGRRGRYVLPAPRCVAAFPFGLWTWGCTSGVAEPLLVYPRFTPLGEVDLPLGERYQPEGNNQTSRAGSSMEFLGCRPFRDGDDRKRLHMRSWARAGYPVVKEFRQEYLARTGIVLDTFRPRRLFEEVRQRFRTRPEFEAAVSLAAALVDFFAARDSRVDLFAAGKEVHHFGGGHGIDYLDHVLDILAAVDYATVDEFGELPMHLADYLPATGGIVLVLTSWNEQRRQVVDDILAAGVCCRAVLVGRAVHPALAVPEYLTTVAVEDVLAGRCVKL